MHTSANSYEAEWVLWEFKWGSYWSLLNRCINILKQDLSGVKSWQLIRWILFVHSFCRHLLFWLPGYWLKTIDAFNESSGYFKPGKLLANKCPYKSFIYCSFLFFGTHGRSLWDVLTTPYRKLGCLSTSNQRGKMVFQGKSYAESNFYLCYSFPKQLTVTSRKESVCP